MSDLPEHVHKNCAKWYDLAKEDAAAGEQSWKRDTPVRDIWHVPEDELHMFPDFLPAQVAGPIDHSNLRRVRSSRQQTLLHPGV